MTKQLFILALSMIFLSLGISSQTHAHPSQFYGTPRPMYHPVYPNQPVYRPIPVRYRQPHPHFRGNRQRQVFPVICSRGCPPGYTMIGRRVPQGIAVGEPHPDDRNLCNCKLINVPRRR